MFDVEVVCSSKGNIVSYSMVIDPPSFSLCDIWSWWLLQVHVLRWWVFSEIFLKISGFEEIFILILLNLLGQGDNNQKYVFVNEPKSWRDAQTYCRQHHTELVSVRNEEENHQIQQLIPAGHFAYIGLFKDNYVWSDNSTSSFRNWDSAQPDESGECVAQQLRDSKLWDDQTCSAQKPFFCSTCV